MRWLARVSLGLLVWIALPAAAQKNAEPGWPEYGANLAGQRYSTAQQINRTNVADLRQGWTCVQTDTGVSKSAQRVPEFLF